MKTKYEECWVCEGFGVLKGAQPSQSLGVTSGTQTSQVCNFCHGTGSLEISEKDLACGPKPAKVAAIFDGHRWQLVSTSPVEIAIVICPEGQNKPRPVTVENITSVADSATFRETVQDRLAELTQSGQLDQTNVRRLAEFTK